MNTLFKVYKYLEMDEEYTKIKTMYDSGRYECDLKFYQKLAEVVQNMDLYDLMPKVKQNLNIVTKISELTERHLHVLEEQDNEEEALKIIQKVNKQIENIDTNSTKQAFQQIEKMGGKSKKERIIALIKSKPYKKQYLQKCQRILNNVYDPKMAYNEICILGIFMTKNQQKITQFCDIYKNVINHGIQELKKFRENCDFITKNPEIRTQEKVQTYIHGSYIIFNCLHKFNEIYKILSGDNKFGLKLGSLKHVIQFEHNKNYKDENIKPIDTNAFQQTLFDPTKQILVCGICLRSPGDHNECKNVIKLLYNPK